MFVFLRQNHVLGGLILAVNSEFLQINPSNIYEFTVYMVLQCMYIKCRYCIHM